MNASITLWRQKVGAITATWLCCHGCHFITVWWNCLILGGLLQQWLILMFIILVCLYFVKSKSYEHSLIIYWTALVYFLTQFVSCFFQIRHNFLTFLKNTVGILERRKIKNVWPYYKNLLIRSWVVLYWNGDSL